jgi:transposase
MQHRMEDDSVVGVDIAATTFTAVWTAAGGQPNRPTTFAQTPDGYTAFMQQLASVPADTLIVMEATSSYWVALAVALHEAGYHVSVVNPKHLHHYAKSLPRRSKTDALDAALIQQFALERPLRPWTPPPTVYHELRQRLVARDALAEMRQQARNQRHALQQWPVVVVSVKQQFDAVETELTARLATLDAEIAAILKHGAWAQSAALLQGIAGIGPTTTAWLLVATLNFELCATPEAAVAYVGLDPLQHESGTSVWQPAHIGRGGHARVRKALYLASLSAAQHNPAIRTFYERLRARGKPMKVARCAAARKLLHIAWAVVSKGQPFDPQYHLREHPPAAARMPAG